MLRKTEETVEALLKRTEPDSDTPQKAAQALFDFLAKPNRTLFGKAWFDEQEFYILMVRLKKSLPKFAKPMPAVRILDNIDAMEASVQLGCHVLGTVGIDFNRMNEQVEALRQVLEMSSSDTPLGSQNPFS